MGSKYCSSSLRWVDWPSQLHRIRTIVCATASSLCTRHLSYRSLRSIGYLRPMGWKQWGVLDFVSQPVDCRLVFWAWRYGRCCYQLCLYRYRNVSKFPPPMNLRLRFFHSDSFVRNPWFLPFSGLSLPWYLVRIVSLISLPLYCTFYDVFSVLSSLRCLLDTLSTRTFSPDPLLHVLSTILSLLQTFFSVCSLQDHFLQIKPSTSKLHIHSSTSTPLRPLFHIFSHGLSPPNLLLHVFVLTSS